ncbi:putative aldo/keto reductase [Streptomyces sp. CBMAI 2042]|nr:putative aldo/keto reductase [Streptomyces sp. CBMAI 2042]
MEQPVELATSIGCTLPQLAVAFTVAHPAVTSAIIGPRTMEQLEGLLQGAPVTLDDATLDRIDEIVRPGVNLYNPAAALPPRSLTETALRRRPLAERAAA